MANVVHTRATLLQTNVATTSAIFEVQTPIRAFQAVVVGPAAVAANIDIQVSQFADDESFISLGTITLSGTVAVSDGFVSPAPWRYVRAEVLSVTGGVVSVAVGV